MKKILVPICVLLLASCYYDKEDELYPTPQTTTGGGNACDTVDMSYATDIAPIINAKCAFAGCHDATSKASGYDLSDYAGVKAGVDLGPRFLGSIKHDAGISPMPKGGTQLEDCNISKISAWINAGMAQ